MGTSKRGPHSKYQKLEDEMERSNQDYIEQQHTQQQVIFYSLYKHMNMCQILMKEVKIICANKITQTMVIFFIGNDGETR